MISREKTKSEGAFRNLFSFIQLNGFFWSMETCFHNGEIFDNIVEVDLQSLKRNRYFDTVYFKINTLEIKFLVIFNKNSNMEKTTKL